MTRRRIAGGAAALLLALVLAQQPWAELPRRARYMAVFAPKELAVRRLGGSGAAVDRRYFSFLENARRRIPPGTPGVALRVLEPRPDMPYLYLATYCLAPLPVSMGPFADGGVPKGWITALYGANPAGEAGLLARLPEGVLIGPSPGPQP